MLRGVIHLGHTAAAITSGVTAAVCMAQVGRDSLLLDDGGVGGSDCQH